MRSSRFGAAVTVLLVAGCGTDGAGSVDWEGTVSDSAEILEVGFFAPSEIESLETPGWMTEFLEGVLESGDGAHFHPPTWRPPAKC